MPSRYTRFTRIALLVASGVLFSSLGALAQSEVKLDRLTIALPPTETESNHFWLGTPGNYQQHEPMLETLIGNDPVTNAPVPRLAKSWEYSDDFLVWTFYLQEGVPFHFGYGEFTARDVVHTLDLLARPDAPPGGLWQSGLRETEVLDDYTIRFHFDTPLLPQEGENMFSQASARSTLYITSKAQWDATGLEGMEREIAGTGPFRFKSRGLGTNLVLERIEDHWRGDNPQFRELEMRWVPEQATRLAMLLSGEAQMAFLGRELSDDAVNAGMGLVTADLENMQVALLMTGNWFVDGFEPQHDPSNPLIDPLVRRALNHAVDQQEIREVIYSDRASPLYSWGWRPEHIGWDPTFPERFEELYAYDPEKARDLLAQAGYGEGELKLTIEGFPLPGQPEIPDLVDALHMYFTNVGIDATIRDADSWGAFRSRRDQGLAHGSVYIMRNTPIRLTGEFITGSYSTDGWAFLYLDEYLEEQNRSFNATSDVEERDRIAREVGNYVFELHTHVPLASTFVEVAVDPRVVSGWTWPAQSPTILTHWYMIDIVD